MSKLIAGLVIGLVLGVGFSAVAQTLFQDTGGGYGLWMGPNGSSGSIQTIPGTGFSTWMDNRGNTGNILSLPPVGRQSPC